MDMHSDLEYMVATDMLISGYNPYDLRDVELYWEVLLNGN